MMMKKLWTIQHRDAYQLLMKKGVLRANEQFLFCKDELRFAYDWMAKQMKIRIGSPPDSIKYPVWAWYQWEGQKTRRDLRFSGYAKRGTPMVQLEFEIDEKKILLSDFDDWHVVLNNTYLADNKQDFDDFYATSHKDRKHEIEISWNKIFETEKYCPDWNTPLDSKSIQATLWEINISQIKKVEFFIAK